MPTVIQVMACAVRHQAITRVNVGRDLLRYAVPLVQNVYNILDI